MPVRGGRAEEMLSCFCILLSGLEPIVKFTEPLGSCPSSEMLSVSCHLVLPDVYCVSIYFTSFANLCIKYKLHCRQLLNFEKLVGCLFPGFLGLKRNRDLLASGLPSAGIKSVLTTTSKVSFFLLFKRNFCSVF